MFRRQSHLMIPPVAVEEYDPTIYAMQVAYRELAGNVATVDDPVVVKAWCIVFQQHPQSRARYRKIEKLLGLVNGRGYVPMKLKDIAGLRFASLSERTDIMGEFTTIWVSRVDTDSIERGAVLACLNGTITHLIAIDPNEATGDDRAHVLVEKIAKHIAERAPEMLVANEVAEADAIERLPNLDDLAGLMTNATIDVDTYENNQ